MATPTHNYTKRILHAVGRVCAEAIGSESYVFAVTDPAEVDEAINPTVVGLSDDFTETGFPFVTLALGPWTTLYGGEERLTFNLVGSVWAERVPLGTNTELLYSCRDALADAFVAHTKAFNASEEIQSAVLMGGAGVRARTVPRSVHAEGTGDRVLLTLPFDVQVKANRPISPQPA